MVKQNELYSLYAAETAAAGINILGATVDDTTGSVLINYEFQWRNRGNYTWSKSIIGFDGFNSPQVLRRIYDEVRSMRDTLEDPDDRGRYYYSDRDGE